MIIKTFLFFPQIRFSGHELFFNQAYQEGLSKPDFLMHFSLYKPD